MDLQAHKRTLSIVHICFGILNAIVFIVLGGLFTTFFPFIETAIIEDEGPEAEWILSIVGGAVGSIFVILFIFTALPSIVGGIATLQGRKWGMIVLMIAGCLSIFSFPIGTALGVYTIYVFVQDNRESNDKD